MKWKQMTFLLLSILLLAGCAANPLRAGADRSTYLPAIAVSGDGEASQTIQYEGTMALFPNPERGFYDQQVPLLLGDEMQVIDMSGLREQNVTLLRVYILIDEFREKPINNNALAVIEANFAAAREAGIKLIPRFAYNFPSGDDYPNAEDATLAQTLAHIEQLAPILQENADVIAYMNMGFVGAWGEWHSSSNGHVGDGRTVNDNSRAIIEKILTALPEQRTAVLRYPRLKQSMFGNMPLTAAQAYSGSNQARVGALNDCLLASETDWGTYSPRENQADIEAYKDYLSQDNLFVPQGGETCNAGEDAQPFIGCENALADLARMRWSALHNGYLLDVLELWQAQGCYEEVERRLGYRLWLKEATFPTAATAGDSLRVRLLVQNDGFAAPYNPRGVVLILRSSDGDEVALPLEIDPRFWLPGETHEETAVVTLPADLAAGEYELLLHLPDPEPALYGRSEYSIRLANEGTWEAGTGYNDLQANLRIARP